MDYLYANRILTDYQHGFRQRRSCESQLIETVRNIADSLDHSGQVDAILLDFSKALDKVDHATLLSKMHAIQGVTPCLVHVVLSRLHPTSRRQRQHIPFTSCS